MSDRQVHAIQLWSSFVLTLLRFLSISWCSSPGWVGLGQVPDLTPGPHRAERVKGATQKASARVFSFFFFFFLLNTISQHYFPKLRGTTFTFKRGQPLLLAFLFKLREPPPLSVTEGALQNKVVRVRFKNTLKCGVWAHRWQKDRGSVLFCSPLRTLLRTRHRLPPRVRPQHTREVSGVRSAASEANKRGACAPWQRGLIWQVPAWAQPLFYKVIRAASWNLPK